MAINNENVYCCFIDNVPPIENALIKRYFRMEAKLFEDINDIKIENNPIENSKQCFLFFKSENSMKNSIRYFNDKYYSVRTLKEQVNEVSYQADQNIQKELPNVFRKRPPTY